MELIKYLRKSKSLLARVLKPSEKLLEDASYDRKILKRVNLLWRAHPSGEFDEDTTDYYRKMSCRLKSKTREPKLERSQL